jgi:hypothetical protein
LSLPDAAINGIPFINALIVDNKYEDVEELENDLKKRNMSVSFAESSTKAEAIIKLKPEINLIIIDWFLDEDSEAETKLLLDLLKDHTFAPIIVYTDKGIDQPSLYFKEAHLDRVAIALDKAEVKGDTVFEKLTQKLTDNPEMSIFLTWSNEIKKRLSETLWGIHNLDIGGLRALLELLKTPEGYSKINREQDLIDFFGLVLNRKLVYDDVFLGKMKTIIDELQKKRNDIAIDVNKLETFHAFERYKPSKCNLLWTGSVLKVNSGKYLIVVTPECDFSHDDKIKNVLVLEAKPLTVCKIEENLSRKNIEPYIRNKKDIIHYLPYLPGLSEGLICRFDMLSSYNAEALREALKEKKLECITIIDSPFIENLIQRMNAYLMRLGVRDLDEAEITKMLDKAMSGGQIVKDSS